MSCQENRKRGGLIDGDADLWWCSGKRKEYNGLDRESTKKETCGGAERRQKTNYRAQRDKGGEQRKSLKRKMPA